MHSMTITGRNLAHAKRDATQRAFLGADIKLGIVALNGLTDKQIAQIVGSSLPYQRAAVKVAARPELRAQVERHEVSLTDAAKSLRPAKKMAVASEISAEAFVEMFAVVGKEVRGAPPAGRGGRNGRPSFMRPRNVSRRRAGSTTPA